MYQFNKPHFLNVVAEGFFRVSTSVINNQMGGIKANYFQVGGERKGERGAQHTDNIIQERIIDAVFMVTVGCSYW